MKQPPNRKPRHSVTRPADREAAPLDVRSIQDSLITGLVHHAGPPPLVTTVEVTQRRKGSIVLQFMNADAGFGVFITLSRRTSEALRQALQRTLRGEETDEVRDKVYGEYRESNGSEEVDGSPTGHANRREAMLKVLERLKVLKLELREKYGEFDVDEDLRRLRAERLEGLGGLPDDYGGRRR